MTTSAPFPSLTRLWHTTPNAAINPTRPELSAKGKIVAITGGGSGIGASIARAFAEAGASGIAIIGRTEKTLQSTKALIESTVKGANVFAVTGDIANQASIDAAFAAIHERFGEINVFVSNAGYLNEPAVAGEAPVDDWWRSFEVNVKGALYATQAFIKHGASDAVVIGVSSAIAHIVPIPGFSAYAASKLAGTKFFDYVQAEYPNLHVVHIQPGVVESTLNIKSKMPAQDDRESIPTHLLPIHTN
jgi:NAD(P)-dependent dehydrogenase (short-subunit alcohol dehydrogenase family)